MGLWSKATARWVPWLEMRGLERELESFFRAPAAAQWPQISVQSDEKGLRIRALVPGFALEDLEVSVREDVLSLRGKRKAEAAHEVREFERSLKLPFPVEAEKVKAVAKDGVLDVELPRKAVEAGRRIQGQAGSTGGVRPSRRRGALA